MSPPFPMHPGSLANRGKGRNLSCCYIGVKGSLPRTTSRNDAFFCETQSGCRRPALVVSSVTFKRDPKALGACCPEDFTSLRKQSHSKDSGGSKALSLATPTPSPVFPLFFAITLTLSSYPLEWTHHRPRKSDLRSHCPGWLLNETGKSERGQLHRLFVPPSLPFFLHETPSPRGFYEIRS
ncbi:hypothetical protein BDY24DRAFT_377572 [Mrakia frigida]|uniref:uncharacterized protein n=1 Tax=Mrakia frigida TaxID=29902 RepID=UPI003FCBF608